MKKKPTEDERLAKELRYYSSENIAEDFKTKSEREAIAAVLKWLSMHAIIGWRTKGKRPLITMHACARKMTNEKFNKYDVVVLERSELDHAQKILVGRKKL